MEFLVDATNPEDPTACGPTSSFAGDDDLGVTGNLGSVEITGNTPVVGFAQAARSHRLTKRLVDNGVTDEEAPGGSGTANQTAVAGQQGDQATDEGDANDDREDVKEAAGGTKPAGEIEAELEGGKQHRPEDDERTRGHPCAACHWSARRPITWR